MPRKTREKLDRKQEARARYDREEAYRRLEAQLHRQWRERAIVCHDNSGEGLPFGVVETPKLLV